MRLANRRFAVLTRRVRSNPTAAYCPALTNDGNANWPSIPNNSTGTYASGVCNSGYFGSPQRLCLPSGWQTISPACQRTRPSTPRLPRCALAGPVLNFVCRPCRVFDVCRDHVCGQQPQPGQLCDHCWRYRQCGWHLRCWLQRHRDRKLLVGWPVVVLRLVHSYDQARRGPSRLRPCLLIRSML